MYNFNDNEIAIECEYNFINADPYGQLRKDTHLKLRILREHIPELFEIYKKAAFAANNWFNKSGNESYLADIFVPFCEEIYKLKPFCFEEFSRFENVFFDVKNAGFWRSGFGDPHVGTILNQCKFPFKIEAPYVVITHGLCIMQIMPSDNSHIKVITEIEFERASMKIHLAEIVVPTLNDFFM